jgi:hypothetical protein
VPEGVLSPSSPVLLPRSSGIYTIAERPGLFSPPLLPMAWVEPLMLTWQTEEQPDLGHQCWEGVGKDQSHPISSAYAGQSPWGKYIGQVSL